MPDNPVPKQKTKSSSKSAADGQEQAREVISILYEISTLLNTHLDRTTLSLCVSLIENGVNPEALAAVIKELRRESRDLQQSLEYENRE